MTTKNSATPAHTATSLAVGGWRTTPPPCIHCGAPANPSGKRLLDAYNSTRAEIARLREALEKIGSFYTATMTHNMTDIEGCHVCHLIKIARAALKGE